MPADPPADPLAEIPIVMDLARQVAAQYREMLAEAVDRALDDGRSWPQIAEAVAGRRLVGEERVRRANSERKKHRAHRAKHPRQS